MSFNWEDYFVLAEALNNSPDTFGVNEAAFRCAASRAYYSAFCTARNIAIAKHGLSLLSPGNVHQEVAKHYLGRKSTLEKQIGDNLRRLRYRRNQADYDDTISISPTPSELAKQSLSLATRILSDLKKVK